MSIHIRQHRLLCVIYSVVVWLALETQASAHFLFVRIGAPAEAGRSAEVYFSEQAEAGDPKFVAKIAQTRLWIQTRPGAFRELTVRPGADRLRAALPSDQTLAIVGRCEYGVVARPKQTPFLLRYYPKAVAGDPALLDRLTPNREIPFEIQASFTAGGPDQVSDGKVRLVALRDGKPIPNAAFTAVDTDLSEQSIKAGPDGTAIWSPPAPGRYSVYTRETLRQPGKVGDQKFDEIREFATLALHWPLETQGADTEAARLFKAAIAHRAEWHDFPGFSADVGGQVDGRPFTGTVTVGRNGSVSVDTSDATARPWLQDQLTSIVTHRLAQPGVDSHPGHEPRFRFADETDDHPLGRLLTTDGDAMGSSYRIKDGQITVVNRRIGKMNMSITVLDNDQNPDGRLLPHSYIVHYWDATTGKLDRVETFQERSKRLGAWDLPLMRSVVTSSDGGLSVKSVDFSKHALSGGR
jgi:hypothetical protein